MGDTQSTIGAAPTWFRKPVIPEIATKRCWQSHPPAPPVAEHVPAPPFGAPSSKVANAYEESTVGVPNEWAREKIVAVMYVLDGELMLRELPP